MSFGNAKSLNWLSSVTICLVYLILSSYHISYSLSFIIFSFYSSCDALYDVYFSIHFFLSLAADVFTYFILKKALENFKYLSLILDQVVISSFLSQ